MTALVIVLSITCLIIALSGSWWIVKNAKKEAEAILEDVKAAIIAEKGVQMIEDARNQEEAYRSIVKYAERWKRAITTNNNKNRIMREKLKLIQHILNDTTKTDNAKIGYVKNIIKKELR